jgi:hypothetical protein
MTSTIDLSQFAVLPAWAALIYVLLRGWRVAISVVIEPDGRSPGR